MAKIISYKECGAKCDDSKSCHYPECPESPESQRACKICQTHCPCCMGPYEDFCNQCSEEDCDNRNKPYNPNAISKEE